ncbi:MAG: dTDP-4-amino-4,6-dideoxy-D-glucose transaminase [Candidatus Heimdallarchaeota archaeon AB_125]|nr:MAG: dTDP-4-amino-4,6-dideoxy-D-glucose transaminase [Candidatus Heimdallarchaeota archaeon AB_125]
MIPVVDVDIRELEMKAVQDVVKSKYLVEGPNARAFEEKFAKFSGAKFASTIVNGTCALHLAMVALDIGPNDEVITTPYTFVASSNTILFSGAIPVFADIDRETYNLDLEKIEEKITEKTKAIMPVHIFGNPCDMKAIMDIAEDRNLIVIEDCAQGHGAKIDDTHVGNFGSVGCFSFYGTKNLVGGEGGAVITNDEDLFEKMISIKNHGRSPAGGYAHYYVGFNYRMTDMTAAIMNVQMDRAKEILSKRHYTGDKYRKALSELEDIDIQKVLPGHQHSDYIMAPLIINEKFSQNEVIEYLKSKNVGSRSIYSKLSYQQPCYQDLSSWHLSKVIEYPDYSKVKCSTAEYVAQNHFEIPMVTSLTDESINYIIDVLGEFFK